MFQHEKSTRNASRDVLLILIKFNGEPPNITKECFTLKTSENKEFLLVSKYTLHHVSYLNYQKFRCHIQMYLTKFLKFLKTLTLLIFI